jgi:hypothetical protein
MKMDGMPKIEEGSVLPPILLTPQQDELCNRLDLLNQTTIQGQELSEMFRGAIYATREENRSNPDWMAQSAHSLREIIFQFNSKWMDAFKLYGSATTEEEKVKKFGRIYGKITDVAHHKYSLNIEEYEKLIGKFQEVLLWALARQIDVHKQIDNFLSDNKPEKSG